MGSPLKTASSNAIVTKGLAEMASAEEVARGIKKGSNSTGSKRGSVNNANRLSAFAGRGGQGGADWGDCAPGWLHSVVVKITGMGGAVTFGLSRDRGAHSVTLLLDDNRETLWFNGDADLEQALEEVCAVLDSMD